MSKLKSLGLSLLQVMNLPILLIVIAIHLALSFLALIKYPQQWFATKIFWPLANWYDTM